MKLFLVFYLILAIKGYNELLKLKILHSQAEVANYTLNFETFENFLFFNFDEIRVMGKFCHPQNYLSFRENCYRRYLGYNSQWILLINSTELLNEFIDNYNNDRDDIQAIIINNDTVHHQKWELKKFLTILSGNSSVFYLLMKYDIRWEEQNIFVYLHYFKHVYSILNVVFFVLCLIISIGLIFFTYIWHKRVYTVYYNHINQIQRSITFLPFVRIVISFLFTFFIFLYNVGDNQEIQVMTKYIEIIITTLLSVYKTFFWFILMMISHGWIIYKETISREELKIFFVFYITIYILIFFDPFFDSMFTNNIRGFKFSDLKNIVIFIVFSLIIVWNSRKIYRKVLFKYRYARQYLPQYCPSLRMKMSIMNNVMFLSILYCLIYLLIVLFFRKILNFYSNVILFESTLKINEDLFMFYFLYIFRPRVFPQYFTLNIEDEHMNLSFFKLTLPDWEELEKKDYNEPVNTKSMKEAPKDDINYPVVLINPYFEVDGKKNLKEDEEINLIDKVALAYK